MTNTSPYHQEPIFQWSKPLFIQGHAHCDSSCLATAGQRGQLKLESVAESKELNLRESQLIDKTTKITKVTHRCSGSHVVGVHIRVGVHLGLGELDAIVEDHHLHLASAVVDPGEDVVVDGVHTLVFDQGTAPIINQYIHFLT